MARRLVVWALVGLLAPGAAPPVPASEPALPQAPALTVTTDPSGAAVYLDGAYHGRTPVSVGEMPPGDHRVLLVRDGYLENRRIVSVGPGRRTLSVRLTPDPGNSLAQVEETAPAAEKKGGGKKWLFVGLGAVAAGAGAFLLLGGNSPPVAGTVGVSPTGTGLMAATNFSFSSNASDPDGDPLTYSWNFGDGGSASGATASHIFTTAGSFNVTVTVSDGKKSATASATVSVRDVNGRWVSELSGTTRTWVITQAGTQFTGTYSNSIAPTTPGTVRGTLGDPRRIFNVTAGLSGFIPFRFEGDFNDQITSFSGRANDSGFSNTAMTFNRQ